MPAFIVIGQIMQYGICAAYFSSESRIRLDFGYQRKPSLPVNQIR